MAGNSTFVLRWEIDKATSKHKIGKAESDVFNAEGFRWTAKAERDSDGIFGKFSLQCEADLCRSWKCEAYVVMRMLRPNGVYTTFNKERFCFNEDNDCWIKKVIGWNIMTTEPFNINDKVTLEFLIDIINSEKSDDFDFVLQWEINNATAKHEAGRADSKAINEGGFTWKATGERNCENEHANFTLRCDAENMQSWNCHADVLMRVLKNDGTFYSLGKERFCFNANNDFWSKQILDWNLMINPCYNFNDKVSVEFHIDIISSESGEEVLPPKLDEPNSPKEPLGIFDVPNRKSNVILKIGDKKLHVSKEFLGVHSPVCDTLFFGDQEGNGNEEVEITDVVYEEFLDLLRVLYMDNEITDSTVLNVIKLADQFQIEHVLEMSKKHFIQSKGFDTMQKLIVADKYGIITLRDHCIDSFASIAELTDKLKVTPQFASLSEETKLLVLNRMLKLKLQ